MLELGSRKSALETPKMRRYGDEGKAFYLAKGVVTENGQPKISVSRWNADYVLRQLEQANGVPEGTLGLPSLYESHKAAEQDPELRGSIFSQPAEWQGTFVLNPNSQTETPQYVLMDDQERVLHLSEKPRSLNPVKIHREGDKGIVVANVFDIPFDLKDSRYDPEDLDQTTGFLTKLNPKGKYGIWFGSNPILYAAFLIWDGDVGCGWEPWNSYDIVGLRGRSTGSEGSEKLFETKEDVLHAQAETANGQEETVRAQPEKNRREILLGMVEGLETHYRSGLEKLQALREEMQKDE